MVPEAMAERHRALALDPTYGPALNLIAYCQIGARDYEKALHYLRQYAAVSPGDANPFDSMGDLYFHLGELDEAIAQYKEVVEIRPDFGAQRQLAYLQALKEDWPQAIARVDAYIASSTSAGDKAEGQLIKGWLLARRGRTGESLRHLDIAAAIFDSLGALEGMIAAAQGRAVVHLSRGEFASARREFAWCGATAKTLPRENERPVLLAQQEIVLCLGELLEGKLDSARTRLRDVRASYAGSEAVRESRAGSHLSNLCGMLEAELLLAKGSLAEAIRVAGATPPLGEIVMGTDNVLMYNFPVERDVVARAYRQLGETGKAIAEYERLVTFDPKRPERFLLVRPIYHYRPAPTSGRQRSPRLGRARLASTKRAAPTLPRGPHLDLGSWVRWPRFGQRPFPVAGRFRSPVDSGRRWILAARCSIRHQYPGRSPERKSKLLSDTTKQIRTKPDRPRSGTTFASGATLNVVCARERLARGSRDSGALVRDSSAREPAHGRRH